MRCETELIQHFYVHLPEFYRVVGVPERRLPTPHGVRIVRSFSSTPGRKKENISVLCRSIKNLNALGIRLKVIIILKAYLVKQEAIKDFRLE